MTLPDSPVSTRWLVRGVAALLVASLLAPSAIAGVEFATTTENPSNLRASVDDPANGTTVISIQGFHFQGMANEQKPARLLAVGPRGTVEWIHNGSGFDATWFYDVDPLDNGHLLVTATADGTTLVYELDPETQERVWTERLNIHDTHDVDLVNGDQLLVANMRQPNKGDRLFLYDRRSDEVVWEWRFSDHYPKSGGGDASDWTHVNDIDKVADGEYLVSPRNFDQVILVNRSTDDIEMRLGSDDNHSVLYEQHNPQYLRGEGGTPTILVADSENDRVVEYAKTGDGWNRTWSVGTRGLNWPRDADRLPNGNTLVVDTMNHRVFEMTPRGRVVWEFHAPWAPYDAERITYGDEPGGPTIREQGESGSYNVSGGGLALGSGDSKTVSFWLVETFSGTLLEAQANELARTWAHVTPWIRPIWMTSWEFLAAILGSVVLVGWLLAEGVYQRHRLRRGVGRIASRVSR